jgi:hypothetical protein
MSIPTSREDAPWPDDTQPIDVNLDAATAVEAVEEAIAVTAAAIEAAQHALRTTPDNASPAKLRDTWHVHTVLALQAVRLIDERARRLNRAVDRLRRSL